jgi:periplasmic divalent cation tolerance protein
MAAILLAISTAPHGAAGRIAGELVRRGAAACVNLVPGVRSTYRWKGRIEHGRETLMLMKTTARRRAALIRVLKALHPYENPELLFLPVRGGLPAYLAWVGACVKGPR